MQSLTSHISIVFDHRLFTKDPMSSALGQDLVRQSVEMIAESGLDHFTFKKLAQQLESTESTIYRYFQNKHQLAMYLASWHWSQLEWRIAFATANIDDPCQRLEKALTELCFWVKDNPQTKILNEAKLQHLVIATGFNSFLPLDLTKSEKEGYTCAYLYLTQRLAEILKETHKQMSQPQVLAATIIQSVHHHMYLQLFHPNLIEVKGKDRQMLDFFIQTYIPQTPIK